MSDVRTTTFMAMITGAAGTAGYPFQEQTILGGTLQNMMDGRVVTSGNDSTACTVLGGVAVGSGDYGVMLAFGDVGQMRYVFVPMGGGGGGTCNAPQRGYRYSGDWAYDTPTPLRIKDDEIDPGYAAPQHVSGLTFHDGVPTYSAGWHITLGDPPAPRYLQHYIMDAQHDIYTHGNILKLVSPENSEHGANFPWIEFKAGVYIQDRYKHVIFDDRTLGSDAFYTVSPGILADWEVVFGSMTLNFKKGILVTVDNYPGGGGGYTGSIAPGSGLEVTNGLITGATPAP